MERSNQVALTCILVTAAVCVSRAGRVREDGGEFVLANGVHLGIPKYYGVEIGDPNRKTDVVSIYLSEIDPPVAYASRGGELQLKRYISFYSGALAKLEGDVPSFDSETENIDSFVKVLTRDGNGGRRRLTFVARTPKGNVTLDVHADASDTTDAVKDACSMIR